MKFYFILALLVVSFPIFAQENNDSIQDERLNKQADTIVINEELCKLRSENTYLLEKLHQSDIRLINTSSNFLYIAYEAFSIDSIAIPAFNAVYDSCLKEEHQIKYILLRSYRDDIEQLIAFLERAEKELSNPFAKNATDLIKELHSKSFYAHYQLYDDWQYTYFGDKLVHIEKQLFVFDGKNVRVDFSGLKKELQSCLDTANDI